MHAARPCRGAGLTRPGLLTAVPAASRRIFRSGIASGARLTMTMNATSLRNDVTRVADQPQAANGLAIVRLTIGAMFVWVFFENLGKGLYTPAGYAGLINYYIKASHSPAAWKAVMGLAANHAGIAAPLQGLTELSLGGRKSVV